MDRPKHWGLVLSGLTLLTYAGGCRSMHSKIPPEPRLAQGGAPQAQFSSDPPPATGPSGMSTISPGLNGSMAMPGQAPGGSHGDVPIGGLGTPTSPVQSPIMAPSADPSAGSAPGSSYGAPADQTPGTRSALP